MAENDGKKSSPPYVSYSSFSSFIKGLAETHVPGRIDKTVMTNYSGSTVYALLPTLQWLDLIDEYGAPQSMIHSLAEAIDDEYKALLNQLVREKYHFLFDGSIDLSKASSGQVIEAFKGQDVNGSTVTKCISFFLSIAKDAGINVSSHVKPPTVKRNPSAKKRKPGSQTNNATKAERRADTAPPPDGREKISFSLRDKPDVTVFFPTGLVGEEAKKVIKATIFNLKNYYEIDEKIEE